MTTTAKRFSTTNNRLAAFEKRYPDSFLLKYIGECKSGKKIIGHELMTMLDILLADLDSPEYRFDTTEAQDRKSVV